MHDINKAVLQSMWGSWRASLIKGKRCFLKKYLRFHNTLEHRQTPPQSFPGTTHTEDMKCLWVIGVELFHPQVLNHRWTETLRISLQLILAGTLNWLTRVLMNTWAMRADVDNDSRASNLQPPMGGELWWCNAPVSSWLSPVGRLTDLGMSKQIKFGELVHWDI